MANEDVSRIMQNKPHLRYSLAFVHIKVCRKAASAFSFCACVRARTLWNYIARASVVVSQLLPHSGVNYVYLEHPLRSHLSVSSFIRVIFRVKMHSFARDISLCLHVSSLYSSLNRIYLIWNFEKIDPSRVLPLFLFLSFFDITLRLIFYFRRTTDKRDDGRINELHVFCSLLGRKVEITQRDCYYYYYYVRIFQLVTVSGSQTFIVSDTRNFILSVSSKLIRQQRR